MTMHIKFAADAVVRAEGQFSGEQAQRYVLECYADDSTVLKIVDMLGDEKASSIAATIRSNRGNRYAKVTSKQRFAIATAILAKYATARAALAAAYGVSEDEFMTNAGK